MLKWLQFCATLCLLVCSSFSLANFLKNEGRGILFRKADHQRCLVIIFMALAIDVEASPFLSEVGLQLTGDPKECFEEVETRDETMELCQDNNSISFKWGDRWPCPVTYTTQTNPLLCAYIYHAPVSKYCISMYFMHLMLVFVQTLSWAVATPMIFPCCPFSKSERQAAWYPILNGDWTTLAGHGWSFTKTAGCLIIISQIKKDTSQLTTVTYLKESQDLEGSLKKHPAKGESKPATSNIHTSFQVKWVETPQQSPR